MVLSCYIPKPFPSGAFRFAFSADFAFAAAVVRLEQFLLKHLQMIGLFTLPLRRSFSPGN